MSVLDNKRHEAFAQAIVKGMSATEAYGKVGYKPHQQAASRLLSNVVVQERIDELTVIFGERNENQVVVDRAWVMAKLTENAAKAMQEQAVMAGGEKTGEYKYDGSVANKALELLGKEIGMFIDRAENTNSNYNISDKPKTEAEWTEENVTEH